MTEYPKRVLLTGGAGFIGHHTISHFLQNTDHEIVVMDRLTYAGNQNFILDDDVISQEIGKRVKFIYHDFRSPISDTTISLIGPIDIVIHMGAESHVDRSIEDPRPFIESNVIGTMNMLEYAKDVMVSHFLYVSTDEVYGPSIGGHAHKEGEPHLPSNPYSASKSGAEALCYAYYNTYGVPVIITNTMNNFGERQNPEKFIPMVIKNLLLGKPITVHCKRDEGKVVDISSRYWLHARNHADALLFVLDQPYIGFQRYNVVGEYASVEEIVKDIGYYLNIEPDIKYVDFHSFRPGHDMHYGLDGSKMKDLGWEPPMDLHNSLRQTVEWSKNNKEWLEL